MAYLVDVKTNELNNNTFKTFTLKTRKEARALVNVLKAQGFKPNTPIVKSGSGWLVANQKTTQRLKLELSYCANIRGSLVSVTSKRVLKHSQHPVLN